MGLVRDVSNIRCCTVRNTACYTLDSSSKSAGLSCKAAVQHDCTDFSQCNASKLQFLLVKNPKELDQIQDACAVKRIFKVTFKRADSQSPVAEFVPAFVAAAYLAAAADAASAAAVPATVAFEPLRLLALVDAPEGASVAATNLAAAAEAAMAAASPDPAEFTIRPCSKLQMSAGCLLHIGSKLNSGGPHEALQPFEHAYRFVNSCEWPM